MEERSTGSWRLTRHAGSYVSWLTWQAWPWIRQNASSSYPTTPPPLIYPSSTHRPHSSFSPSTLVQISVPHPECWSQSFSFFILVWRINHIKLHFFNIQNYLCGIVDLFLSYDLYQMLLWEVVGVPFRTWQDLTFFPKLNHLSLVWFFGAVVVCCDTNSWK